MTTDSRIAQMRALADDIRCVAADIQEETTVSALTRVRTYCKWILSALDEAEKELTDAV